MCVLTKYKVLSVCPVSFRFRSLGAFLAMSVLWSSSSAHDMKHFNNFKFSKINSHEIIKLAKEINITKSSTDGFSSKILKDMISV